MFLKRISIYAVPLLGIAAVAVAVRLYMTGEHIAGPPSDTGKLRLVCDRTLREPIAGAPLEHGGGVIELFHRRSGVLIEVKFAGPDAILESAASGEADLLLPADPALLDEAQRQGLIADAVAVTKLVPTLLVNKGNPQGIESVADLARPGIRVAVMESAANELGRVTEEILARYDLAPGELRGNTTAVATAREAAEAVHREAADAAIVWRHEASRFAGTTQQIAIPADRNVHSELKVAVLASSRHAQQAGEFVRFLAGSVGQDMFARHHFGEASSEDDIFELDLVGGAD